MDHENRGHSTGALRWARIIGMVRDALTALVGVAVLMSTPPSLIEFGADDIAVIAWSFLPLAGGLISLVGILRNAAHVEVVGSFTVGAGFVVWSLAAAAQPDASLVSYSVAGAFLVLALNSVVRGLIVATGLLSRGGAA